MAEDNKKDERPGDINTQSGEDFRKDLSPKANMEEVPTEYVEFTFSKKLGYKKKGHKYNCHRSTAQALEHHKLGKITKVHTEYLPKTFTE